MSTDLHDRARQPSPEDGPDKRETPKSSFSIVQIVGGALAAMTAAALGSRLSLAGTVLGAAFASIIAAVAGAIYTASLRRTSQGVSTVIARVRPGASAAASRPDAGTTAVAPTTTSDSTADTTDDPATAWDLPATPAAPAAEPAAAAPTRRGRLGWKQVLVGALLMFLVAVLVLTGIELATGRALSGGNGTTVGQVADPGTRPSPTPTRATPTATPSATPSTSTGAEPSATAAPSSTPSSEPTAAPSPSSTPAPSVTPTPTAASTPTAAPSAPGATPTS